MGNEGRGVRSGSPFSEHGTSSARGGREVKKKKKKKDDIELVAVYMALLRGRRLVMSLFDGNEKQSCGRIKKIISCY